MKNIPYMVRPSPFHGLQAFTAYKTTSITLIYLVTKSNIHD